MRAARLKLGHARGVAMLAAIEAGVTVVEYTPAEIKRSVVGYGRAEKPQVAQMVKLLLGLDAIPKPHDATDALAVAICHLHRTGGPEERAASPAPDSRDLDRVRPCRPQALARLPPDDCAISLARSPTSIRID